jgi:hypothetical protein
VSNLRPLLQNRQNFRGWPNNRTISLFSVSVMAIPCGRKTSPSSKEFTFSRLSPMIRCWVFWSSTATTFMAIEPLSGVSLSKDYGLTLPQQHGCGIIPPIMDCPERERVSKGAARLRGKPMKRRLRKPAFVRKTHFPSPGQSVNWLE